MVTWYNSYINRKHYLLVWSMEKRHCKICREKEWFNTWSTNTRIIAPVFISYFQVYGLCFIYRHNCWTNCSILIMLLQATPPNSRKVKYCTIKYQVYWAVTKRFGMNKMKWLNICTRVTKGKLLARIQSPEKYPFKLQFLEKDPNSVGREEKVRDACTYNWT